MKIFVIGSLSQEEDIKKAAEYYKFTGNDVDYVRRRSNAPLQELVTEVFDKIYEADKVIVVPKQDDSFGTGVTYEMAFAKFVGTPICKWAL